MLQFGIIPTSEFFNLITNRATDATKAVVHMVKVKIMQACTVRIENKRSFVELRPVVKHVEI